MTNKPVKARISSTLMWIFLTAAGVVCGAGFVLLKMAAASELNGPKKVYLLRMMWLAGILLIAILVFAVVIFFRGLIKRRHKKTGVQATDTSSIWEEAGKRLELENEDDFSLDEMLSDDDPPMGT